MQNISKPSGKYPQLDWLPNVGVLCSSLTWSVTFDLRARRDKNSFRRFVFHCRSIVSRSATFRSRADS
uniref:Uncharacterized protein n=1 Tax=Brassica oleracea TaxID=3712 RepID=A0A3P6DGU6_BRAOL|nr:unnamed protein product [Brassica oleracea]